MICFRTKAFGRTTKLVYLLGSSLLTQPCIQWCFDLSNQLSRKGEGEKKLNEYINFGYLSNPLNKEPTSSALNNSRSLFHRQNKLVPLHMLLVAK